MCKKVLIIGTGVSGLTTAHQFLQTESGDYQVELWSGKPEVTTGPSTNAYAFWYPQRSDTDPRFEQWVHKTYDHLQTLSATPDTGVSLKPIIDLQVAGGTEPWWHECVRSFRHARPDELTPEYGDGHVIQRGPVIDVRAYMKWLRGAVVGMGATIVKKEVTQLAGCREGFDFVVNCAGLGARALVTRDKPFAERVQVISVARTTSFNSVVFDGSGPNQVACVVPHDDYFRIGGVVDEHNESLVVDDAATSDILARCSRIVRGLTFSREQVREVVRCVRPALPKPRVEQDETLSWLFHYYGLGGAGFTTSAGCAAELVRLIGQQ
jgi:D-amino-acid oxidase